LGAHPAGMNFVDAPEVAVPVRVHIEPTIGCTSG
jgi:hypothetical protein